VPSDLSLTALRALSRYARMMLTEEFLKSRALERAFKLHENAEKEVIVMAVRRKKKEKEQRLVANGQQAPRSCEQGDEGKRNSDKADNAPIVGSEGGMSSAVLSPSTSKSRRRSINEGFVDKEYAQLATSEWDAAKADGATAEADHWLFTVGVFAYSLFHYVFPVSQYLIT
jgi:hypothetical protein